MNFLEWHKAYHNKKIFKLFSEFSKYELKILNKLGIIIEDKIYTEYEYECFKLELGKYYIDDDIDDNMDEEDWEYVESLENKNVSREEYNKIKKKFDKIGEKYQNQLNKLNF